MPSIEPPEVSLSRRHNTFGGYGQIAWGRHQYGAAGSNVNPRYWYSNPKDNAQHVNPNRWIVFTTYCYSSCNDLINGVKVEVSEDEGVTYSEAVSPRYDTIIRLHSGQTYWVKIRKTVGQWPSLTYIYVRYTGMDEFGNVATKELPVVWGGDV
jgi:uncharacterized membrane-anchored protein